MKFSIDKHILSGPLERVSSAMAARNLIPILSGIMFHLDEKGLSLTAGNSFIFIRETIGTEDFQSIRMGSVVLPGDRMVDIAKKSGDVLDVEVKNLEVTIKSGSGKFKLMGLEVEDYPEIPEVDAEPVIISSETFKKVIKKTIFSTGKDKNTPPIITGINFEFREGKLRATATDRHRMSRLEVQTDTEENFSSVISRDNLLTILKAIPDGEVEFLFGYSAVLARVKGISFYSRVLEGSFPDLDRLINVKNSSSAVVNVSEFIAALDNVDIVAKYATDHKAKMTFGKKICIEAKADVEVVDVEVDVTEATGEEAIVLFKVKHALELLKSLDNRQVKICFNGSSGPIMFYGVDESDGYHLLMPLRLQAKS
jgi:DNA polymerase-3 subunit beta